MRRFIAFVTRHHEPVERWEFNLFAAVGIGVFVIALCAAAYVRVVERSQAQSAPASWDENRTLSRPGLAPRLMQRRAFAAPSPVVPASGGPALAAL